jgi:TetR/AcrR family transcriptional regulator, transcriptional repressor for nem operon
MPRPTEFDTEEVVRQVMEVFWTHGYNATSIQDLVESTGVLRGSLYHTFSDKHTLYLQGLTRYGEIALGRATDLLEQPDSLSDRVRRLFMDVVELPEE